MAGKFAKAVTDEESMTKWMKSNNADYNAYAKHLDPQGRGGYRKNFKFDKDGKKVNA